MNVVYNVFNKIVEELNYISNALSPYSVKTLEELIAVLENWKDVRWYLLYNDESTLMYSKSTNTNLLESELNNNRRYLRDAGLDLQDYKYELSDFNTNKLRPLSIRTQYILDNLDTEIGKQEKSEPTKPKRFVIIDGNNCENKNFPNQYKTYKKQHDRWEHIYSKMLNYKSVLLTLESDLTTIEKVISDHSHQQAIVNNVLPKLEQAIDKNAEAKTPDGLQPRLVILASLQTRLFLTLSIYVLPEEENNLEQLLTNGTTSNKVWLRMKACSLGFLFKDAIKIDSSSIASTNLTETAKWLSAYFSCGISTPESFSSSYMYGILRGNKKVDKTNQLRLKQK